MPLTLLAEQRELSVVSRENPRVPASLCHFGYKKWFQQWSWANAFGSRVADALLTQSWAPLFLPTRWFGYVAFVVLSIGLDAFGDEAILFEEKIAPIMRQNCVACHHAKKAEGGLSLESFASMSRGGDSGVIIDPQAVDKSILLERITGQVEPIMPPIDNAVDAKPLTTDQIMLIRRWVEGGTKSKATASVNSANFQTLPAHVQTSYAMALTPDGDWLAFSRGNDLVFHPIHDWNDLVATIPQQIIQPDAHSDICFAIAASPDGQRIASGSSGEVKLWRKRVARMVSDAQVLSASSTSEKRAGEGQMKSEPSLKLSFDGAVIERMASSRNGLFFATLDERHRLRIWNSQAASLEQEKTTDCILNLLSKTVHQDADRQKRRIDRWNAKLIELQAVVDKESKSLATAKTAAVTSKTEWESKQSELQPIAAAIAELEKSIVPIQAAVDAAKQQAADLLEKQKQAKADVEKLQIAITGTQALIELGNQKIAELTTQLEPKKKALSELQPQEVAAKTKFESAQQAVKQSEESHRLALAAAKQQQLQLAPEPTILERLQSDSDRLEKESTDVWVRSISMAFTENGKHLVSINEQNQLEVYSTAPLQRISAPIPLERTFLSLQSIGDNDVVLTDKDDKSERWTIETRWELECILGPDLPGIISDRVNAIAFSHDGTRLAIGSGTVSRSGHLAILELDAAQAENLTSKTVRIAFSEPELHSDTILGLAYSPDGRMLASCGADKMTKLIDLETLKPVRNFEGHTHHVLGVAWQNDGVNLATTSADGTVKVWDAETGETTRTLTIGKELTALSFVGHTNRFVSAVIDHTVRLHDISSNDQVRQFGAAKNALYAIAVSPDGRFAIAIGQEGLPRAWQIEDGKLIAEINAPH